VLQLFYCTLLVAQLVEALRYKPEGCRLDSFLPHYVLGVESASNSTEYQEYFLFGKGGRCIGLTTLPPSCDDCIEIWDPQNPGTLRVCNRPVQGLLVLPVSSGRGHLCDVQFCSGRGHLCDVQFCSGRGHLCDVQFCLGRN
jgi:hypothetical protein